MNSGTYERFVHGVASQYGGIWKAHQFAELFSRLRMLCSCIKMCVYQIMYQKNVYKFLYISINTSICTKNTAYVSKKMIQDGTCIKIIWYTQRHVSEFMIFVMFPCINPCIVFFDTYWTMYQKMWLNLIQIAICIIFSIHQCPCIKKCMCIIFIDTNSSYFLYIPNMYQIYDTYVDTHFDILIHHDLVILCLQFDTLRLNR